VVIKFVPFENEQSSQIGILEELAISRGVEYEKLCMKEGLCEEICMGS